MAAFSNWQSQLLRRLGVPVTQHNLQFLSAWQAHEGGTAAFNPLNTTQPWAGASSYNSVGVRNYGNPDVGLAATIKTLRNGHYPAILAALQSGNPTWTQQLGQNLNTWGTGSGWMQGYRNTPVGSVPPAPPPGHIGAPSPPSGVPIRPGNLDIRSFSPIPNAPPHPQSTLPANGRAALASIAPFVAATPLPSKATHAQGPNIPATPAAAGLVGLAAKQLGQPYVWGGESRKEGGFDCSGLVDWAMRQQGYHGPRLTTYNIAKLGHSVKGQPLQPGDLVLANGGEHVVIYAGHGQVIAAPHRGTVVQYQPLSKFHIYDVRRV